MFKRVVIKISGEALSLDNTNTYNEQLILRIIDEIKMVINEGVQISLVVGGGNYFRGRSSNYKMDRSKCDQIGMLATIMNALYLSDYFIQNNIESKVYTPFIVGNITKQFEKEETIKFIKNKGVPIFAGGLGHPYFSTDTITALRAIELNCDCILFAKNVDGIYDCDPKLNSNAKKYDKITYKDMINKNLNAIDMTAAQLCLEQKVSSIIFSLDANNSIYNACMNNDEISNIATLINV